ncbi:hypothetical protein V6Z12_D02G154500 [Gossypium hirsutum]
MKGLRGYQKAVDPIVQDSIPYVASQQLDNNGSFHVFNHDFFSRFERSIAGIPLIVDRIMSPSSISRSISLALSKGPGPLLPKSLSFQETPLTGGISTIMLFRGILSHILKPNFFGITILIGIIFSPNPITGQNFRIAHHWKK